VYILLINIDRPTSALFEKSQLWVLRLVKTVLPEFVCICTVLDNALKKKRFKTHAIAFAGSNV